MNDTTSADWDPRAQSVLDDQIKAYDDMRHACPVAHSDYLCWSLFRHADVLRAAEDHDTFSNAASRHLSVPNGMDLPEHTPYRRIVEGYFTTEAMLAFEPRCRAIATALVESLPDGDVEMMAALGKPFALHVQCAFMGWPERLHEPLRQWVEKNQRATLARDREAMAAIAVEFDGYIREQLATRRDAGEAAPDDVTTRLLNERVNGRPLSDEEIVSIVRNWTVGELGSIAASVGILAHYLAEHPDLQTALRRGGEDLEAAADEILRIHAPLISNRRVATCPVTLGDREIAAGERLTLMWASANRDETVFGDPDAYQPQRNRHKNLLYGAGLHVCPGAPLARLELRLILEALLEGTQAVATAHRGEPERALYPAGGFTALPLHITRA